MKKLMTSTIILLPLLILAIMLVSGAIMSFVTHIYVERVEFTDSGTLVMVMTDEAAPPAEQLEVNVLPLKAENRGLVYSISDENIAQVDENGVVTAKYYGETYVTVASKENKAATARRKIIVTDNSVHDLKMNAYDSDMYVGESQRLRVEVLPAEADNKNLTWQSSDDGIASVTAGGEVICNGYGTAQITAKSAENPQVTATATIKCHQPLGGISVDTPSVAVASRTAQFPEITFAPHADPSYTVVYDCSDDDVASVDGSGAITFNKAGKAVIMATATDARNHSYRTSVEFACTDGYYMGELFENTSYAFDYDEWQGRELDIPLRATPVGSNKEILNVRFSRQDIITFDSETEKFRLNNVGYTVDLGEPITVTIEANKYDAATGEIQKFVSDVCRITLTRKTQSVIFTKQEQSDISKTAITEPSIDFSEGSISQNSIGVVATPANHTDVLHYEVASGSARIQGTVLTFYGAGTAIVNVTVDDGAGGKKTLGTIEVTYTEPSDDDKLIEVDVDTREKSVTLAYYANGKKETGLLNLTVPAGMTAVLSTPQSDIIDITGDNRLVPLKGGFATVTVTFRPENSLARTAGESSCVISVYVDRKISVGDISFSPAAGYVTSKESLDFTVTLNVAEDVMAGKKLLINGEEATASSGLVYNSEYSFPAERNEAALTASVVYDDEAQAIVGSDAAICTASCKVTTTHGKLSALPPVTLEEAPLPDTLEFDDIGASKVITIDLTNPTPADFVLTPEQLESEVKLTAKNMCGYTVALEGKKVKVTLTAQNEGEEQTTLQIAGQSISFKVKVNALADKIEVRYNGSELKSGVNYTTFLPTLSLNVGLSHSQNRNISDGKVLYSTGGDVWKTAQIANNTCVIEVDPVKDGTLTVKTESEKTSITINLSKLSLEETPLSYHIEYTDNGNPVTLQSFTVDNGSLDITFPKSIQGTFEICAELSGFADNLGMFDALEAEEFFSVGGKEKEWEYEVSATTAKIIVTVPAAMYFNGEEITFTAGKNTKTFICNRNNIESVEFEGFDSQNTVNNGDVYKGYQQVRVFAKHSYYYDKTAESYNKVDYFRIPVNALSDLQESTAASPESLTWTLTRYVGDKKEEVVTAQRGTQVSYNGATYTIQNIAGGNSVLKLGEDTIAENGKFTTSTRVPWVDVFAEQGYAYIYFGDFAGLSESDVYNDYFGAFDDKPWTQPAQNNDTKGGGITVAPSANAYSFLRVEAGDGAQNSKANAHFNFNVLQDEELVNVFDAQGYYDNSKVVLHTDLYGEGELDGGDVISQKKKQEAEEKGLFLTKTTAWNSMDATVLGKEIVYGNGYQVNLQAKNEAIKAAQPDNKNNSWGVRFGKIFNLFVKGANQEADGVINYLKQKIVLQFTMAYYCDLQLYTKSRPIDGGSAYVKSTVLHSASQSGFQLYYSNEKAYLENIIVLDCAAGLTNEKTLSDDEINGTNGKQKHITYYYFKGNIEILNYTNLRGVASMAGAALSDSTLSLLGLLVGGDVSPHYEWFGKQCTDAQQGTMNMPYFNLAIYTSNKNGSFNFWDGEKYVENNTEGEVSGGAPMKRMLDLSSYKSMIGGAEVTVWTYNYPRLSEATFIPELNASYKISIDGRLTRNGGNCDQYFSKMFTPQRYIRLLCQYVNCAEDGTGLVKNDEHILWHIQQAYRDVTLIPGRNSNHIEALKDSITGKDIVWNDGTTPEQAIAEYDKYNAVNINNLLSTAILPEKREYE